ncbi:MAG: hypothetical protein IT328_12945 [Caldilineaceae bacterium]|nr:hypothetical protein [Caldilineaceae bacterium]
MSRLSATLLFAGVLLSLLAGIFHPERAAANDHAAAFTEYAASANWTAIHLGQFVGMAVLIAGLVVLFFALDTHVGTSGWAARFGTISAVITLALYGVLQAVDGVALKQAVDAWVAAPDAEKMARFASAETIRWLEWAVRSYQSFMLGLALILFGIAIVSSTKAPRAVGYLMGLSGLAYIVQGWILGSEGFSANNSLPTLAAYILIFVWSIWLLIRAWRMKEPVESPTGYVTN